MKMETRVNDFIDLIEICCINGYTQPSNLSSALLCTRVRPRFFDQIGQLGTFLVNIVL